MTPALSWRPATGSVAMRLSILLALALAAGPAPADARTVYRCVRDGTVSLATAPEPGSECEAREIDDNAVQTPNLWGAMGVFSGTLYAREREIGRATCRE